jgi:hypothetical protein
MRRLWVAGAAMVVCLALGAPVMAQQASPAAAGPVLVTATGACSWFMNGNVQTGTCTHTASDPRVSGPATQTMAEHVGIPGGDDYLQTFDTVLTGPDGTWTGRTWVVFDWPNNVAYAQTVLTGDGSYEGWTYVDSARDTTPDANTDSVGVLYEGPPPPGITTR